MIQDYRSASCRLYAMGYVSVDKQVFYFDLTIHICSAVRLQNFDSSLYGHQFMIKSMVARITYQSIGAQQEDHC